MKKRDIESVTKDITKELIKDTSIELVDVEYVKEGTNMFLRVYIDKEDGISIEDCQSISRELSKKLDEVDPIEDNYFLEVSSPGIDRPLKTDKDLSSNLEEDVEMSLYKSLNGKKKLMGTLKGYDEDYITIIEEDLDEIKVERNTIAKINLAIKF